MPPGMPPMDESGFQALAWAGGEANELIDEVARSEVNEMGDTMATAGGGGEVSGPSDENTKEPRARKRGGARGGDRRRIAKSKGE